jgi:hypothetical protein
LPEIWRDDAPGERRAALVENGNIVEIHIQRDTLWALGETGTGRIDLKTPSGAYVVTDSGHELLLRSKIGDPEGARVTFEVTRDAIAEPGRIKPAEIALRDSVRAQPSQKDALWDARLMAFEQPVISASIADGFDIALSGQSQLGSVIISFQRTKAGLVFDVDGMGSAFDINQVAAAEIARLLRLYQVGAMVMIDFVSMELLYWLHLMDISNNTVQLSHFFQFHHTIHPLLPHLLGIQHLSYKLFDCNIHHSKKKIHMR